MTSASSWLALTVSTHVWFLANGASMTVLALLALRTLNVGAVGFGLLLAVFGLASLAGATLAPRLGERFGAGPTVVWTRASYAVAWTLPAIAPGTVTGQVLVCTALALLGLAAGLENPNEMGLWQSLTSGELLGRVNATRRSVNRTMAALGALVAGASMTLIGERATLGPVVIGFAVAAVIVARAPVRFARTPG